MALLTVNTHCHNFIELNPISTVKQSYYNISVALKYLYYGSTEKIKITCQ